MINESACEVEEPTHSMESNKQGQHTEKIRVKAPSVSTRVKQNAKHKTGFQAERLQTYPWLLQNLQPSCDGESTGLLCAICISFVGKGK